MQKYIDGTEIKVGDIFTDGTDNHQQTVEIRVVVMIFNLVRWRKGSAMVDLREAYHRVIGSNPVLTAK